MKGFLSRYLPQIAVLALVAGVLGTFVSQKEGYHMDELLSFELSNAEFTPWIVPTQPEGRLAKFVREELREDTWGGTWKNLWKTAADVWKNRGESSLFRYRADVFPEPVWIDRQQFSDYITVGKDDAFAYASVYFNVKDDNHPPLHFLLLHTVSSIFRGKAAPFPGCAVNLAAVLGCCILLMKLGILLDGEGGLGRGAGGIGKRAGEIGKGAGGSGKEAGGIGAGSGARGFFEKTGLLAALLYGLSSGAVATVLLIRMYGVMTFWCVALCYLHGKKWSRREFAVHNRGLIAVTVLGFWTQYFFLFYCFALAAVTVWQLAGRGLGGAERKKELWGYLRSMLIAAVVGVAGFPFAVADVFSSGRGTEAWGNLANGLQGYGTKLVSFGKLLWRGMFGAGVAAPEATGLGMFSAGCGWVLGAMVLAAGIAASLRTAGRRSFRAASRGSFRASRRAAGRGIRSKRAVPAAGRDEGDGAGRGETAAPAMGRGEGSGAGNAALVWMFVLPPLAYFLLAARMSPYLVDRYIMAVFPFALGSCAVILYKGAEAWIHKGGRLFLFGVSALCLGNVLGYDGEYLYRGYAEQEEAAAEHGRLPCVCIYEGVGYYENLLEFTCYEKTLLLKPEELEERQDTASLEALERAVVIVKDGVDEKRVRAVLEERYGWRAKERLVAESVHGDSVWLWEKDEQWSNGVAKALSEPAATYWEGQRKWKEASDFPDS
ncbi:MAG: hypothetical protein LBQ15_06605 [Clostridium sp.]|jgi:hypothetical protein|nr:hypothetical protein [Clostridium sp.]